MIGFLAITALLPNVSAFVEPSQTLYVQRRMAHATAHATFFATLQDSTAEITWSPQDLTKDNPGFPKIPDDDYIKLYQENPELWPVEFFLIAHRRSRSSTEVLVRRSANGTSKYGVGTGVPATRWLLSSAQPPKGYEWSNPNICFEASKFPEFDDNHSQDSWTYQKIDICQSAFQDSGESFEDPELEEYASTIRDHLRTELAASDNRRSSSWEEKRLAVVQRILDQPNSAAAIQGTLRMSGLFQKRGDSQDRFVDLGATDPVSLAKSVQIYTMFPQMPDPMPLPSTSPEELKKEITSRYSRMTKAGKDLHKDKYGRTYTHISTPNVSNTIHGVYLSLDLTDHIPPESKLGVDETSNEAVPPAFDLFGTQAISREWKSLEDLKVFSKGGNNKNNSIGTDDPKPTFISGFIVRQLVKDGVIGILYADNEDE